MLVSIDVGIKNLAFCLLNEDSSIKEWKSINISKDSDIKKEDQICTNCSKAAKYSFLNQNFCFKHTKQLPTFCKDYLLNKLNFTSWNLDEIKSLENLLQTKLNCSNHFKTKQEWLRSDWAKYGYFINY